MGAHRGLATRQCNGEYQGCDDGRAAPHEMFRSARA